MNGKPRPPSPGAAFGEPSQPSAARQSPARPFASTPQIPNRNIQELEYAATC
jgi:hypothetical protein